MSIILLASVCFLLVAIAPEKEETTKEAPKHSEVPMTRSEYRANFDPALAL